MAKTFSGKEIIKILQKHFGFSVISQRGSHVKLEKKVSGKTLTTVVPLHREVARGTLNSALELADVTYEEFLIARNKK